MRLQGVDVTFLVLALAAASVTSDPAIAAGRVPPSVAPSFLPPSNDLASIGGTWTEIEPRGRERCPTIYDPARDRMVFFGGLEGGTFHNETWALSLSGSPTWVELLPSGTPPSARFGHTAIYDPVRDRMLVFGGSAGAPFANDVWALSFSGTPTWAQLSPTGTPPPGRHLHTAIYDPVQDRMLIFAGTNSDGARNDVWALSLAGAPAWMQLAPSGTPPSARTGPSAIYDPGLGRMVIFGGYDGARRNDTWALSLQGTPQWTQLAPTGGPPAAREALTAVYDTGLSRMVLFGGFDGSANRNDVWALALTGTPSWTQLVPAGGPPPARSSHATLYDSSRGRMLVFGGFTSMSDNDTWALALSGSPAWTQLTPSVRPPSARTDHVAVYDPVRRRLIVFGGIDSNAYLNDTWALSLGALPNWVNLMPAGAPPPVRFLHAAIYDPSGDRLILFGGHHGTNLLNDTWALSLSGAPAWSPLVTSGSPPSIRAGHSAIYDPYRRRMLVFGGYDATMRYAETWALSLEGTPTWQKLLPLGTPPPGRQSHTAVFDALNDRMVIYGGYGGGSTIFDDSWALSFAGRDPQWAQLLPSGSLPPRREEHAGVYDALRNRMVIFGGGDFGSPGLLNDVWALSLQGSPAWQQLAPVGTSPSIRDAHRAIYDPVGDRMVVFGGYVGGFLNSNNTWVLAWEQTTDLEPAPALRARGPWLFQNNPNPFNPSTTISFELSRPSRVSLRIFDVQGRLVRRLVESANLAAGPHTASWNGSNDAGKPIASGMYVYGLEAEGSLIAKSMILLK